MLIDSHAHLNFEAYDSDRSEVIDRCLTYPMQVLNVGAGYESSVGAVKLAQEYQPFYAAVGLHPIHVFDEVWESDQYQKLIDSAKDKVVAMGETGFDYHHLPEILAKGVGSVEEIKKRQAEVFRAQIGLARQNNLAVVVHGRNGKEEPQAYHDIYQVLKSENWNRGVVHCYGGNLAEAKLLVAHGFHLGFTGIVTFDKTGVLAEILKWIPLENILIETDAPYLTPEPHRGQRNEPVYVQYVAEKIASIKNINIDQVIEQTGQNAKKLFNLK